MKKIFVKHKYLLAAVFIAAGVVCFRYSLYASEKLPLSNVTVILDPGHGGWASCTY